MSKRARVADFAVQWSEASGLVLPETRLRLLEYAASVGVDRDAARRIEEHVFAAHEGAPRAYLPAMRARLYNVETNPALRTIDPARIAVMSDAEMRRGTVLEDIQRSEETRNARFEAMLQERYDSVESQQTTMRCRKCKRSNLAFEQKQTRGADEAMTVFMTCKDCGANWKL